MPGVDHLGELVRFAASARYGDLPSQVRTAAKAFLLDTIAVTLAGSNAPGVWPVVEQVREWGGAEQSSIAVFGGKVPAIHAAFANGVMGHALDFDDTHDGAGLHANICVVPALLAAAEMRGGVSGRELMTAHAVGLEVTCRMAVAAGPDIKYGWLPTTLFGCFGATAAVARVLGLSEAEMRHAFGITYSQAGGNRQGLLDGALTKRIQPGLYAKAAVMSVSLARRGITGARNVSDGRYGLYPLYVGQGYCLDRLADGLGTQFELLNIGVKPYPCCRGTHEAIDAALDLARDPRLDLGRLRRVVVYVSTRDVADLVGQPFRLRESIQVDAQFSLQYTVAAALSRGRISLSDFDEVAIRDPQVLELARRIAITVDRSKGVTVEAHMTDGQLLAARVTVARGHPTRALTGEELAAKCRGCAEHAAGKFRPERIAALVSTVSDLEEADDASSLGASMVA